MFNIILAGLHRHENHVESQEIPGTLQKRCDRRRRKRATVLALIKRTPILGMRPVQIQIKNQSNCAKSHDSLILVGYDIVFLT